MKSRRGFAISLPTRRSSDLWRGPQELILASQSRARRMLLENAGLAFEALPADMDERAVQRSEEHTSELQSRLQLVCRLRLENKMRQSHADGWFIVFDSLTLA